MATYVAKDTNIPGGDRYEVDAHFKSGRWEVWGPNSTMAMIMDDNEFKATYEPATTPIHYLDGSPVATSAPPMV